MLIRITRRPTHVPADTMQCKHYFFSIYVLLHIDVAATVNYWPSYNKRKPHKKLSLLHFRENKNFGSGYTEFSVEHAVSPLRSRARASVPVSCSQQRADAAVCRWSATVNQSPQSNPPSNTPSQANQMRKDTPPAKNDPSIRHQHLDERRRRA